jgi:polysaccharide biosynthesis protein PslA
MVLIIEEPEMLKPASTSEMDAGLRAHPFPDFRLTGTADPRGNSEIGSLSPSTKRNRSIRRRFDPNAIAVAEKIVLFALYFAVVLLAIHGVHTYEARTGSLGWPSWQVWSALFPACYALAIVREPRTISVKSIGEDLVSISFVLRYIAVVLLFSFLLWLGNVDTAPFKLLANIGVLGVLGCWALRKLFLRARTRWHRKLRVVIVGVSRQGLAMAQLFQKQSDRIELLGFSDDRHTRIAIADLTVPFLGTMDETLELQNGPDAIVLALPNLAVERIQAMTLRIRRRLVDVYLAPDTGLFELSSVLNIDPTFKASSHLNLNNLSLSSRVSKRLFDIFFSLAALVIFFPIGLIIAILIKLESPGPVIYRQARYGRGNYLFDVYKFRSMFSEPAQPSGEILLTMRGDQRVTRIGAFLRRTSLDEFPQFLNVLRGDMSVVGPRPHPPGVRAGERFYEEVLPDFMERYTTRPGITGLAQVNGFRGNTFTESHLIDRFASDLDYIKNWSLELDLWIVLKTIKGGFGGNNAF